MNDFTDGVGSPEPQTETTNAVAVDDIPEPSIVGAYRKRESEPDDNDTPPTDANSGGKDSDQKDSEPEAKAAPKFDESLLSRAKAYGYDDSDLEAMSDAVALEADMARLDRMMVRDLRSKRDAQNGTGNGQPVQKQPEPTAPQSQPAPVQQPSQQAPQPQGDDFSFDPEWASQMDERTVGELRRMGSYYGTRLKAYEQREKDLTTRFERELAQRDAAMSAMSNAVAKELARWHATNAGEEWKDVVSDPAKVDKAIEEAEVLAAAYQQRGIPSPGMRELVRRGLQSAFGKPIKQQAVQELRDQVRNEKGQFTARPTSREAAKPPLGRDAALAFAEKASRKIFED